MADYSNPGATYLPPHHPQRSYSQQYRQHLHQYYHHVHQSGPSSLSTTSNERHNAGGELANGNSTGSAGGGLQRNESYMSVYNDHDGRRASTTTVLDSTASSQSTGGTRYFDIRPPPQAPTAPGSNAPGGQVTSASPASSYTNATPTQQYTQPQPVYDAQGYVQTPLPPPHHYPHAHHQHHESQLGHQQHATEVEVTSSFQNQPQQPQQQHHQSPYVAPSSSTTSSVTALRQQHQRHQNPQFVLPPPPSFRQPTLPYLPAHPDGVIPHYTFGASPLNESDYAAPKVGQTRCYWTLLTKKLTLAFLDPVLQLHMGAQGPGMATRCILDFVHPDEMEKARKDLRDVLEQKTGTGSITRVRFLRLSAIRLALGASREDLALWKDQERIAFDSNYLAADLVINWVAEGLVLCFIHAIVDLSKQDNDESSKTPWTNWCGAALLDERHCAGLARALESQYLMNPSYSTFTDGRLNHIHLPPASPASTSSTSPSPQNEDGSSDSYSRQYSSSLERDGFPDRIFQVMRNDESREVLCSFPKGNYDAKSMGALSHGVSMTPYGHSGDEGFAKTNCTRRLECTRAIPDQRTGGTRKVETLYIPHGQVIFASHRINPEEPKQHYHPYPSPAYETYPTGAGAWQQSNQDDVPHTPSSHSSQDQSLQGYNAPYASSYGRTNTHYSGSWPPTRETPQEWVDSYSSSYAGDQSNRSVLHSRTQQTQSLRSTQSSQSLYPRGSVSTTGLTPSDPRNAVSFSNTNSGFTAQGSYSNYGHSQTGAGHSWAPTTGWEEHSSAPLPPRELHQTSSFRYQDSYPHPQQTQPETPVSAQASYPYFPDNVSTTLRPVRITGARQSPPGLKRSADDMLYSGGSASGSGDERSASPPQSNMLAYGAGAMGYNNGSPPNAQSRSLLPSQRDGGGPRASGNPPPGVTQCVGCGIESSPEWRKGENGVKNLCNACGLRFARSKQKREGIIPQRRKKKDKAPNSTKGRKPVKGKRYGGDSASPPPLMTTPPEEKAQLMDIVEDHENAYRDPSSSFKMPVSSQYAYYDTSNQHRQY